jgi:hypothetical protein
LCARGVVRLRSAGLAAARRARVATKVRRGELSKYKVGL